MSNTRTATTAGQRADIVGAGKAAGFQRLFSCPGYDVLARGKSEITVWFSNTGDSVVGANFSRAGRMEAQAGLGSKDQVISWFGRA